MARDFEDVDGLDNLGDDDLRQLVRDQLSQSNAIDIDDFTIAVRDGVVILGGRVGTDGEKLIAEHVVTDVLGAEAVQNDIIVDPIRRAESPVAMDEHLVDEDQTEGLLLGDRPMSISPEAEGVVRDDPDHQLFGTTDVGHSIADGTPWIPPEAPTQEGLLNERDASGEDH